MCACMCENVSICEGVRVGVGVCMHVCACMRVYAQNVCICIIHVLICVFINIIHMYHVHE